MTATTDDTASFAALAHTLWRQQRLLELLLCRVEVQQLVLAAGRPRWIERAAADIEEAGEALGEEELVRSVQLAALGNRLGLGGEPTLAQLADAAPEPWGEILHDHHRIFVALVAQVRQTSTVNRELAHRSLRTMNELLDVPAPGVEPALTAYGRPAASGGRPSPLLLDRRA